ncbi:hypothetical protein OSB04_005227, partial [Centaurea solstitialis]
MLRGLIPHGDQKRDKASFLLEVIDYIHFLQEKVNKYEDSCRGGWNNEPPTIIPWNNNQKPTEGFVDHPRAEALVFAPKVKENIIEIPKKGKNLLDCETLKEIPFGSNIYSPQLASDTTSSAAAAQQLWQSSRSCITDCMPSDNKLKEQELTIESGTISISTIYSQGLLSSLTQALQSSGVDLSHANISVQIDLGKKP